MSRTAGLRGELGMTGLSAAESAGVRAALPSTTEAIRLYAQGSRNIACSTRWVRASCW
jgi:hypothetical protein